MKWHEWLTGLTMCIAILAGMYWLKLGDSIDGAQLALLCLIYVAVTRRK